MPGREDGMGMVGKKWSIFKESPFLLSPSAVGIYKTVSRLSRKKQESVASK
jgi:hypothetical protein